MIVTKLYIESEIIFVKKSTHKSFQDLTGQKFGRLTVLGFAGQDKNRNSKWFCRCECGKITNVKAASLKSGNTFSCGCLQLEKVTTHGHAIDGKVCPTYKAWQAMLDRCYNPKNKRFEDWGGRGISVCDHWRNSFENFLEDMGERPSGLSLDRKKNEFGYFKENCRWATPTEQCNNRRNNVFITYEGKMQTVSQLAHEKEIAPSILHKRLVLGWSIEKAFSTPIRKCKKMQ